MRLKLDLAIAKSENMPESLPRVVIVGGGFGGLAAAKALKNAPVRIILIDRTNHHLFQPLLWSGRASRFFKAAQSELVASWRGSPGRRCISSSSRNTIFG
jgi:flavin-dependent dehydrogenase